MESKVQTILILKNVKIMIVAFIVFKLVCIDDHFSKISYLGQDALHKFITSIEKESKYCIRVMKKYFNKDLVMTKEDNEVSSKEFSFGFSALRDCNINVSLNYEIPIMFHDLKKYDAHLVTQKLGKFDFKINVIQNGIDEYVRFCLYNSLVFIDNFQFLSSLLYSIVSPQNLGKNDFKHFSQEFDNKV